MDNKNKTETIDSPSERSLHIAARVWCDQDMKDIVMDTDAATKIAVIVDSVIKSQK